MAVSKLSMRIKLAFGIGAAAEGAVLVAFNTFNFLFYNNVLGLSGTLCGLAVTIALILDAMSDPVVGSLSDRWRSRLGRRHPFMYAAPIPLAISFCCIYSPPAGLVGAPLFLWFTLFAILQRQFMTLYLVPHLALGAELSDDYHERSVVMSYNAVFSEVGGAAAFFFGWTWFAHFPGGSSVRTGYAGLAAGVAVFAAAMIFASAQGTRDQIPRLARPRALDPRISPRQIFRELRGCLANPSYRALISGMILLSATIGTRETLAAYSSLFFWGLPESQVRLLGLATPPAFLFAFVAAVRLHRRIDKRATMVAATALTVVAAIVPIGLRLADLFPRGGSPALLPLLLLFVFLFYAGIAVLMISMLSALADIADEHELATGRRQEGLFYASRTFFGKLTSALGHVVAGAAIDLIGFPTGAAQGMVPADVLFKLGVIDGPLASLPSLIAIACYARYRLDRRRHAEIQAQLAARRQAAVRAPAHETAAPAPAPAVEAAPG